MQSQRIEVKIRHFPDRPALQLQWIDPGTGRRRTISAKTADPKLAEQARADHEFRLNNGLHVEAPRTSWETFRAAFEAEYVAGKRPNTQDNYRVMFDLFEQICEPTNLSAISSRTVSQFVAALRALPGKNGRGYMPSTIAVRLAYLRSAFSWAVQMKMLTDVPAFPEVSVPKKRPQPVPAEWVERLLSACMDPQLRGFILCGWLAGMRRNEAYFLSWDAGDDAPWLDLERRRINFPAASCKAGDDQWVPLDAELRKAFLALPERSGPVFRFGVDPASVAWRVASLAKKCGLRLTMRTLRRGFACRYAAKEPAQVLQRLCRHSDIATTLAYYASFEDAIERAVFGNTQMPDVTETIGFSAEKRNPPTTLRSEEGQGDSEAA